MQLLTNNLTLSEMENFDEGNFNYSFTLLPGTLSSGALDSSTSTLLDWTEPALSIHYSIRFIIKWNGEEGLRGLVRLSRGLQAYHLGQLDNVGYNTTIMLGV